LRSGIRVKKIKTWLERNSAFVMDMTDAQAVLLDGILGADNKLIATYAAMTQAAAYVPLHTALDQVLKRTPFSEKLRDYRRGTPTTLRSVLAEVEDLSGIRLASSVLASISTVLESANTCGVLGNRFGRTGRLHFGPVCTLVWALLFRRSGSKFPVIPRLESMSSFGN